LQVEPGVWLLRIKDIAVAAGTIIGTLRSSSPKAQLVPIRLKPRPGATEQDFSHFGGKTPGSLKLP
jgi:hypothetical protein